MSEKRLRALDIAKGIAIILVVIGHDVLDATTHIWIKKYIISRWSLLNYLCFGEK